MFGAHERDRLSASEQTPRPPYAAGTAGPTLPWLGGLSGNTTVRVGIPIPHHVRLALFPDILGISMKWLVVRSRVLPGRVARLGQISRPTWQPDWAGNLAQSDKLNKYSTLKATSQVKDVLKMTNNSKVRKR